MQVKEPARTTASYEFTEEEILKLLGIPAEGMHLTDARHSIYTGLVTIMVSNSKV